MKCNKRILGMMTAVVMAVSAAGCGGGQQDTADVEALITKAQGTMATVESMAAEMTMEMDMALGGEAYETTTVANIRSQQDPLKMQMDLSILLADGTEEEQMQMYAEEKDGKLISYTASADTWYAQTLELDALGQYDAESNMDLYLDNITSFRSAGEEEINGTMATKITGVIAGDAMEEAIADSGVANSAESMGISEEMMESMYSEMKDLPVVLWIDAEGYVLKYEMDMTEMMQKIMDEAMRAVGTAESEISVDITKTAITMVCSDFNAVEEIVIPAEVLNIPVADYTHAE